MVRFVKWRHWALLVAFLLIGIAAEAQNSSSAPSSPPSGAPAATPTPNPASKIPVNYDESKVGTYTLPDPLVMENGQKVRDAKTWYSKRRPEILQLFEENVYGKRPGAPKDMHFEVFDVDKHALGGKAIRKQVTVYFSAKKNGPKEDVLFYLPANAKKPVPLILSLNFSGNQRTINDPGIRLSMVWDRKNKTKSPATEESRGASKWPVETLLEHGIGIATIYYCDIEPDFIGGMPDGVRPLFFKAGQTEPAADEWGAISAWGWGMSRAMDYIETDKDIDPKRVAILGQSRLGKTVLWEGAEDTRFAMVLAVNSGEGGASLARRDFGETVKHMNVNFPYQFCTNYQKWGDHVDQMPVDTHELVALIAPRYLYLMTAEQDLWADPKGEFLAAVAAGPVYLLLGKDDLGTDQMPPLNQPIQHTLAYHYRTGKHELAPYDWEQIILYVDKNFGTHASKPNPEAAK
jgi:hypothetical protein